ncbi:hypothetical protein HM131_02275 [Halobacillus mangrovi]|uniref:Uncharacterized protein n=1 Tax=Halobacillus mangrovi TaxID=402384 RepID=A0A1W5ZR08_9BACI|nr:hypothetical protein HM131_02275 [Halobacillus mangrovi]
MTPFPWKYGEPPQAFCLPGSPPCTLFPQESRHLLSILPQEKDETNQEWPIIFQKSLFIVSTFLLPKQFQHGVKEDMQLPVGTAD